MNLSIRTATWLVAIAQALLMLTALRGGVTPLEWFTTLIPGAGWLTYLAFSARWAAAVALVAMLALVPISLDWLTRATLASWAIFLAAVAFAPPRVRLLASIAMVITAVRCFEQLRFSLPAIYSLQSWLTPAVSLFYWIAYLLYFRAVSRDPSPRSQAILGLS